MRKRPAFKKLTFPSGRHALGPMIAVALGFMTLGVATAMIAESMRTDPAAVIAEPAIPEDVFQSPESGTARSVETARAEPAWMRNAALYSGKVDEPRLAIIVTDDGGDAAATLKAMRLDAPVTLAIAPTAEGARARSDAARRLNREVLLYLPMEPENALGKAPNPIAGHVGREETIRRLAWNLSQLDGFVGVTNQHGEATTRDAQTMRTVMELLGNAGLMFVDARTHPDSVASAVARRLGVAAGDKSVTIRADDDAQTMRARLDDAAMHARKWGGAIVMVPARREAVTVLAQWLGQRDAGVAITPVTAVIRRLRSGAS